jgi:segregation and condensation protein B
MPEENQTPVPEAPANEAAAPVENKPEQSVTQEPAAEASPNEVVAAVENKPEELAGEASANEAAAVNTQAPVETAEAAPKLGEEALAPIVEALLFAAEEPLAPRELARAAGGDTATVRKVLKTIKENYEKERRPWDLAEVAGGWRLVTRSEFYSAIQRLKTQTAQRKLTQAALETLALIAYRQPIGRADIESARGVGAGPVLRQLLEKKLIKIAGRGAGLGQPLLYGTTEYFLEHFGLKSVQDLPKPGEFKDSGAN